MENDQDKITPNSFSGRITSFLNASLNFQNAEYTEGAGRMRELATGQHPEVLLIGCSDSRVDPAVIFNVVPGQMFTVRVVANLVPRYDDESELVVRSALEYGVKVLKVPDIVVYGHAMCGGIKAMIDIAQGKNLPFEFVGPWVSIADSVCALAQDELATRGEGDTSLAALHEHSALMEQISVKYSLENLRGYPWIKERVAAGTLNLHGWWFDIIDGSIYVLDADGNEFKRLEGS